MSVPGLVIVLVAAYLFVRALVAVAQAPRRWRAGARAAAARAARRRSRSRARAARRRQLGTQRAAPDARLEACGRAARELPARCACGAVAGRGRAARPVARARAEHLEGRGDERAADARAAPAASRRPCGCGRDVEGARGNADQPAAVALLARAYRALGDHSQLLELLPHLARASLPPAEREQLAKLAVEGELSRADLTAERLAEVWGMLPSELRGSPPVVGGARAGARASRTTAATRSANCAPR